MAIRRQNILNRESRGRRKFISGCMDSFFPSKNQLNDRRLRNRMKLCALAITLMWGSSLQTAVYISSSAIIIPEGITAYNSCKSAYQVATEERNKFRSCVDVQTEQCEEDLSISIESELKRSADASEQNTKLLIRTEQASDECTSDYIIVKEALELWVNFPQILPINSIICTVEKAEAMLNSLVDVDRVKSEAIEISQEYSEISQVLVGNMILYARLRGEYDVEYLYNHTHTVKKFFDRMEVPNFDISFPKLRYLDAFDNVFNCTSLDPSVLCSMQGFNSFDVFDNMKFSSFGDMNEYVTKLKKKYNDLERSIDIYNKRVQEKFDAVQKFWGGMVRTKEWIDKHFPGQGKDPFFKLSLDDMQLLHFNFPNLDVPPALMARVESLRDLDLSSKIEDFRGNITEDALTNINRIQEKYDAWKDEVEGLYNISNVIDSIIPDDYDPPVYKGIKGGTSDLETENQNYKDASKEFENRSATALETFAKAQSANETSKSTSLPPIFNVTAIKTKVSNFVLRLQDPVAPDLNFDLWVTDIFELKNLLFFVDRVYRIYLTIRLCFKFWDAGSIRLPPVDIRTQKVIANPFKMSNGRFFINLFTNPIVGTLLAGFIFLWVVIICAALYIPLYSEYRNGCVPRNGDGTFISKNVESSSYNYAFQDGASALLKRVDKIEQERTNVCSVNFVSSTAKQNKDAIELANHSNAIQTAKGPMNTFEECIDLELTEALFQDACCNKTGYEQCVNDVPSSLQCPIFDLSVPPLPYFPPGEYVGRQKCHIGVGDGNWELSDAIFNCDKLPICEVTCTGPHEDKLEKVSKECGCMAEWFLHSSWLRGLLSFLIFGIANVTRIIFVDGLAHVLWNSFHPGSLTVWATCDDSGGIFTKKCRGTPSLFFSKLEDGNAGSLQALEAIKKEIGRTTYRFRMVGVFKIVVALTANVLWILIIFNTADTTDLSWLPNTLNQDNTIY